MDKMLLTTAAAVFFVAPAFAQDADFVAIDADQSGGVSYDEALSVMPDLTTDAFIAADVDGSGELSEDEFAAMTAAAQ